MFLFQKIDKNVQNGRKKLSVLKQSPFFGFRFRDAWKESIQKTESNVSVLLNKVFSLEDDRFMQVSL